MELETIAKLSRDIKQAATVLGRDEARFLVDAYYIIQEDRKRSFNQERALEADGEPHSIISWFANQSEMLEKQISKALDAYSASKPEGQWARRQVGIGPIIAAGLHAHIDLALTTTSTKLWRFAGLDPTSKWEKGKKRPWNAGLKVLALHHCDWGTCRLYPSAAIAYESCASKSRVQARRRVNLK